MSGHSKWAKIKRDKGANDSKRSKIFSRISKEITIAVKEGQCSDPDMNPRLRLCIQNAKSQNMPKDVIERAINKGKQDKSDFELLTYEGYANGGVAVFVECLSDNNNRSYTAVRTVFKKYNNNLGNNGSLAFIFDRKGVFEIKKSAISMPMDEFEFALIDAGLDELDADDEEIVTLYCPYDSFGEIQKKLEELQVEIDSAELKQIPNNMKELPLEEAQKVLNFVEALEEIDDVSAVYHNLEITDEIANAL
ncbi:MAG: YebC/PmpR family DNA-binding transcriptional regulator [Bacteroidales bacterium]|nr:YebC/PmpR family DNA-binding transcriptional regulator [Bacteroidales bacterium]